MHLRLLAFLILLLASSASLPAQELQLVNGRRIAYRALERRGHRIYVTMAYGAKFVTWAEVYPSSLPPDMASEIQQYVCKIYAHANQQYDSGAYEKAREAYRFVMTHFRYVNEADYKEMLDNDLKKKAQGMVELNGEWTTVERQVAIFEAAQRAKGLVKFEDQWVTPAEESVLKAKKAIEAMVRIKSKKDVSYKILQALEAGSLCVGTRYDRVLGISVPNEIFYLIGASQDVFADEERYKDDLFWAGTYTYQTVGGVMSTVNCYAFDKETALGVAWRKLATK